MPKRRGYSSSTSYQFAKEGYDVACCSRKPDSCANAMQQIKAMTNRKSMFCALDVTDEKSIKAAFQQIRDTLGTPTVLVYNASGPVARGGILGMDIELVKTRWNVDCLGALLCAREVIPGMLREGGGTLLFTSATSAFRGSKMLPAFAIAKHGLRALSQSIAKEFAESGIHSVHIRLDCTLDVPKYKAKYPNGKFGSIEEIAKTYHYLTTQHKLAWTNELDIRPFTETWTC